MTVARRRVLVVPILLAIVAIAAPPSRGPVRAAEYTLESVATYDVRPADRRVDVRVELVFTNTTPDPAGQFSAFGEILLAVHEQATGVAAEDADGPLEVTGAVEAGVRVVTIDLREDLRFGESVEIELTYRLPDGSGPDFRVRPSLAVFPAWSFGTSGEVRVRLPVGPEVRVDGDPLEPGDGAVLTSGAIDDPTAWLTVVTVIGDPSYATTEASVPMAGGTADVLVRAFGDDPEWGERTLELARLALPLLEDEVGLPYPAARQVILTESVVTDGSPFGEGAAGGTEIEVAWEQPAFTVVHQLAHLWQPAELVSSRWIREGLASLAAAGIGPQVGTEPPYDPAARAEELATSAFALGSWPVGGPAAGEAYGLAASWEVLAAIEAEAGAESIRAVLARAAAAVGPYDGTEVIPEPVAPGSQPMATLETRSFLDQLEAVSGVDLTTLFAERVLGEADVALVDARAEARAAFDAVVAAAAGWGAPDALRAAMAAWEFDAAMATAAAAHEWLEDRDALLDEMEGAGLSAPDRLQQAYRAYGGGPEAVTEIAAERDVVGAYAAAADRVNAPRSLLARLGLVGGADPSGQLALASGRFADGNLAGARAAVGEALRLIDAAETGGVVRLASLAVIIVILVLAAIVGFRRRASYTAAR